LAEQLICNQQVVGSNPSAGSRNAKSQAGGAAANTLASMLAETDRAVLDFEGSWWLYPGPKDRAVSEYLGMSAARYYQVLRRLLDRPEAQAYAPLTIHRLRRMRDRARKGQLGRALDDGLPGT
jgi:hypothetical protein